MPPILSNHNAMEELTRRRFLHSFFGLTGLATVLRVQPALQAVELSHITLNVADRRKSEEFYSNLFGPPTWRTEPFESGLVSFKLGSSALVLEMDPKRRVGFDHFCLSIKDYGLHTTAMKLKQLGVDPEYPYGPTELYFTDSDGLLIELDHPGYLNPQFRRTQSPRSTPKQLFQPTALSHVTLQISDLDRATAFYRRFFGEVTRWTSGASFGDSFSTKRGQDVAWTTQGVSPVGADHFCVSIKAYDPDAVTQKLLQIGI